MRLAAGLCLALLGGVTPSRAGEPPAQQSPQPPVPLVRPPAALEVPPGEAPCARGACPDREILSLSRLEALRGRLLASELTDADVRASWDGGPEPAPVPGALLVTARARLAAFMVLRAGVLAAAAVPVAAPAPDLEGEKRLALCRPPVTVGPWWDGLDWGRWPVSAAWSRTLDAAPGDRVEITFSRLRPALGYLAPDPVAWLLREDEPGDPARGVILAWSDDEGGGSLPRIEVVAPATGRLRVLVAAYQPSAAGRVRLVVRINGRETLREAGIFFGGARIPRVDVAAGDRFLALAGRRGGRPAGADAALFLLKEGRAEGAPFQAANNSLGLTPILEVGPGPTEEATILLSAFGQHPLDAPRLLHDRSGSGGAADEDGDGLDAVLEGFLETCDSACPPGRAPMEGIPGWGPGDTDLDGVGDLEELIGVRRCFSRAPAPPRMDPGPCLDRDRDGRCDRVCHPGDHEIVQPLGPLLEADPTRYDVWVEMDGRRVRPREGEPRVCLPGDVALAQVRHLYDPPADPDRRRPARGAGIAVHWLNDGLVDVGAEERQPRIPSQAERRTWFAHRFTPERKLSGVFRYMVGTCGRGGQSDVRGRVGIVGVDDSPEGGLRIAHELGHLLGLQHNWDRGNPDRNPFYLSLMSYGYMYQVPPVEDWNGDFVPCGPGRPPCAAGFACTEAAKAWRCVPDCGMRSRPEALRPPGFSTGALFLPGEPREATVIPEQGYPSWFLPWLYCYTDERHRIGQTERVRRFLSPLCALGRCVRCEGAVCSIDWDHDGRVDGAERFDADFSGGLEDELLEDRDDFGRILEQGRFGLRRMAHGDLVLVADGMEPGVRTGLVPGGPPAPAPDGGLWQDVTNTCDEAGRWTHCRKRHGAHAALFRGPAAGDRGMLYAACAVGDEACRTRHGFRDGFTLSLRIKVFGHAREGEAATVAWLAGYRVEALADPEGREVRWRVLPPGSDAPVAELGDRGAVGTWTRLTVQADPRRQELSLVARRGPLVLEDTGRHEPPEILDLSTLWVGAPPGRTTLLTGLLDDVVLVSGIVRY
ncbi:MAG: hypothetical protein FJ098_07080 [Deltaproteobacteria bacterium]|nr:hypothetical protein [Deltaproteobacteria bacterium]